MAKARVVALLLALVAWSGAALALPLQDISERARGRVAHLSVRDVKGEERGSGSGFVISGGGRLVTNFHVIDGAARIVAVFPDKREARVTGVWAFDKDVDIAILQLEAGSYAPLTLAVEGAHEGEEIVVIGSPLGLGNSISTGIVSAVRERGIERKPYRDAMASWSLQVTAAAAPGSSGSPILRDNGDVVGVVVGYLGGLEGVHFGIAVSEVQRLVASAPAQPQQLASATGVRSVQTNLLISAAFFAGVVLLWVVGSHVHRLVQARSLQAKHDERG